MLVCIYASQVSNPLAESTIGAGFWLGLVGLQA